MIPRLHRWSITALFQSRSRVKHEPVRAHHVRNPFHAVSIACDRRHACRTARGFGDRRFLASAAPTLPLASCDSVACTCRYEHHDDRRIDPRRAADEGRAEHPYAGAERRGHGDRRRKD
jgi:hypothetical protein